MALDVVDVFEAPPPDWSGARGFVSADLLKRQLPRQFRRYHFFVCGPPAMMDAVEAALLANGVPGASIDSERFNLV
jgi:ferredoxin-NADP reductase